MAKDRLVAGQARTVVHEARARAHAPQRRGAELVPRALAAVLHDPVPRPHVVEQEVAEGVDGLVADGGGDGEGPPVDLRPGRRGPERLRVAVVAADLVEELRAGSG